MLFDKQTDSDPLFNIKNIDILTTIRRGFFLLKTSMKIKSIEAVK